MRVAVPRDVVVVFALPSTAVQEVTSEGVVRWPDVVFLCVTLVPRWEERDRTEQRRTLGGGCGGSTVGWDRFRAGDSRGERERCGGTCLESWFKRGPRAPYGRFGLGVR